MRVGFLLLLFALVYYAADQVRVAFLVKALGIGLFLKAAYRGAEEARKS